MKQMKIKKPNDCIEMWSSHVINKNEVTGKLEIESFEIEFKGHLTEWLEEYLTNPVDSRLHKNLVRLFHYWFE
jgi:hypothetical protein